MIYYSIIMKLILCVDLNLFTVQAESMKIINSIEISQFDRFYFGSLREGIDNEEINQKLFSFRVVIKKIITYCY